MQMNQTTKSLLEQAAKFGKNAPEESILPLVNSLNGLSGIITKLRKVI